MDSNYEETLENLKDEKKYLEELNKIPENERRVLKYKGCFNVEQLLKMNNEEVIKLTKEVFDILQEKEIYINDNLKIEIVKNEVSLNLYHPSIIHWNLKAYGKTFGAYTQYSDNEEDKITIIQLVFSQMLETMKDIKKDLEKYNAQYIFENHNYLSVIKNGQPSVNNPFGLDVGFTEFNYISDDLYSENLYLKSFLVVKIPKIMNVDYINMSIKNLVDNNFIDFYVNHYFYDKDKEIDTYFANYNQFTKGE